MGDIIGLISGKGGVGKTTITACLGAALSEQGYRVLLCDGDFGLRDLDWEKKMKFVLMRIMH